MRALIIVDIQNDFVPGGALAVADGDAVVPVANRVMDCFDLIVATRDWHPEGHGSFALSHPGTKPGDVIDLNGLEQVLWPVHCVQDTKGADFVQGLDISRVEKIFVKGIDPGIDSYSCFYDNGHLRNTGLGEYLRERGVDEVYLLGLATDYCVKYSALDAVALGFRTYVILDGCRGVDLSPGDIGKAVNVMKDAGVTIVTSDDVCS